MSSSGQVVPAQRKWEDPLVSPWEHFRWGSGMECGTERPNQTGKLFRKLESRRCWFLKDGRCWLLGHSSDTWDCISCSLAREERKGHIFSLREVPQADEPFGLNRKFSKESSAWKPPQDRLPAHSFPKSWFYSVLNSSRNSKFWYISFWS